ncbi:MAG: M28 family peptidase [Planctomycetota bacterium]|nr:M28 family peptidase [Planctomycetota bacterium]MDG1984105.1 M28 family peptidase [Planctomycetota bacterium]
MLRVLCPLILLAPCALALQVPEDFPGDLSVSEEVGADELRSHVQALASDAMQGRAMGSEGSHATARYLAARLAAAGFEPGAGDGSFLQRIPLQRVTYSGTPELRVKGKGLDEVLYNGESFTFSTRGALPGEPQSFKVLVVGEASDVPSEASANLALVMTTSAMKSRRWLSEAGHGRGEAFGMIILPRKAKVRERSTPKGSSLGPVASGGVSALQLSLRGEWSERFSKGEVTNVTLDAKAAVEEGEDFNVVGFLKGAGSEGTPELAGEIVVLSAHRDHIGVSSRIQRGDPEADAIMNGADDDASGCAAVMEVAEALAAGKRPARSVVAIFDTGEERGFVGSSYWVGHPTHPIDRVVCALNFEMLGRPDPLVGGAGKVWLTGDERSDLGPVLRERGVAIKSDLRPAMSFFTRSDNVPFAKAGIVAQTLSTYGEHEDYHQPSDEWETLDYAHMEASVRVCLAAAKVLADGPWKPSWNEGEPRF